MSVTSQRLVDAIGKLVGGDEVRALLRDLDLPEQSATTGDDVAGDYEATMHGVAVIFGAVEHLRRKMPVYQACAPEALIISDVIFSRKGFGGGPGFSAELPHGITWTENRDAARARLGPPAFSAPIGANDRWQFGDRYLTISFYRDPTRGVMQVVCGLGSIAGRP